MRKSLLVAVAAVAIDLASAESSPDSRCQPLPGWETIAGAGQGGVIVFGEYHGTQEGPAAVAEFVCAVSTEPVLLAVELSSMRDADLQRAWNSTDEGTFAEGVLAAFDGRTDGVGSEAMFAMLKRVHGLKQAGADIDVVAFEGVRDDAQRDRFKHLDRFSVTDAAQAENIHLALKKRPYRYTVALTGTLGAGKVGVDMGPWRVDPMATRLSAELPDGPVIGMMMLTIGGTRWECKFPRDFRLDDSPRSGNPLRCGLHEYTETPKRVMWLRAEFERPMMRLFPTPTSRLYDGEFYVAETHASPPFTGLDPIQAELPKESGSTSRKD